MPKIDLLPCPFCGAKDKVTISSKKTNVWRNGFGDTVYYRVYSARCNCCNARGSTVGGLCSPAEQTVVMYGKETQVHSYNYYHDKAAEAWNTRASGWIPCSKRLPEDGLNVLVYDSYGNEQLIAWYDKKKEIGWHESTADFPLDDISDWMPLPESPKRKDDIE